MTKYIKGKDGKFAGSIGDGKTNVPTPAPKISKAEQRRQEMNDRIREINARWEAGREERELKQRKDEAGRQAWFALSEELTTRYPEARWMYLDDDFALVDLKDTYSKNTVATGEDALQQVPALAGHLALLKEYSQVQGDRYKQDGLYRIGLFRKCGEDGCEHLYYPEGFQPNHTASQFCMSGRRNHCTCDTCF